MIDIVIGILLVQRINQKIEIFAQFWSQCNSLIDLPPINIVLLSKIELNVHEKIDKLFDIDIISISMWNFDNFKILDPDINIRKIIIVPFIKIAHFDPFIDHPQRHIFMLRLIRFKFIIVVYSASLVHELYIALPAPIANIKDHKHNKPKIKAKNGRKGHPPKDIEVLNGPLDSILVIEHNFSNK